MRSTHSLPARSAFGSRQEHFVRIIKINTGLALLSEFVNELRNSFVHRVCSGGGSLDRALASVMGFRVFAGEVYVVAFCLLRHFAARYRAYEIVFTIVSTRVG